MDERVQSQPSEFRDLTLIYPAEEKKQSFTLSVPRAMPLPSAILCHGLLFRQDDYIEDAYWMQYSSDAKPFRDIIHGGVVFFHPRPPSAV